MGFIKEAKTGTAAQHADRARAEGHTVLLYRFNVPSTSSGFSGPVSGAAEVIEAIEQRGWRLAEMAYDGKQSSNGAVMLLFRMPPPPAPAPSAPRQYAQAPGIPNGYQDPYGR